MSSKGRWLVTLSATALAILAGQSLLLSAELTLIDFYQQFGSPTIGRISACRFEPSCSHYAEQVLLQDGLWKGNVRIVGRLANCSPAGRLVDWIQQ